MASSADERRGSQRHPYGYKAGSGYGYPNRGGYGSPYGYGGYGYGYGAGPAGGSVVERTLQDYLLILRERYWYVIFTLVAVFGAAALYTFTRIPVYQATTTVQIFRKTPTLMQVQQVVDNQVASAEDLNTQVNILKSAAIIEEVANQIQRSIGSEFIKPYQKHDGLVPSVQEILEKNRDIQPERLSLIVAIQYNHPNPIIAAKVANLFADAYIDYNAQIHVDESMQAVRELQARAEDQRKKVDDIAAAIQAYREKNNLVSLDQRHDIVTETLKELNTLVNQTAAALQNAETKWRQVELAEKSGQDLVNLPFIASSPAVAQLQGQLATQKIAVAQLSQRYRAKHPVMIQAMSSLKQAQQEYDKAVQTSVEQIRADYQSALQNYAKAQQSRDNQESKSLSLDRYGLEYANMQRDFEVNEKILEQILDTERIRQNASTGTIENQNARTLDRALAPRKPKYPQYVLDLLLALAGGLGGGLSLAFVVAYLDDRIKSAFDIESVVGLPILGIIPEVKRMGEPEQMSANLAKQEDREVTEAFSTLMSSLQLKDESKNAQCILITSTIAGEGKSFIATNLAQTYAAHGQKVVIVDCDLRRPAVNRVFHLENLKGVIDVCTGEGTLDAVIHKEVRPNLDVVLTGGRSKNPTQILNSKEFALMLSELRRRYTKIFIDTPPIAIVTDAFLVLPATDGAIYSIYFNKVRRKVAQYSVQRLLETNVPSFGAVLNGLTGGVGGYYYAHYYDRSYKDYYIKRAEIAHGKGAKIEGDR